MPRVRGSPGGSASAPLQLGDGADVAVIGAGPAGSFFTYFLLDLCERAGRRIHVDLYESRDFSTVAPAGCNMCGGIVSESLVQMLAVEGIDLPTSVVQRGIDSYMLHTDAGSVRIDAPLEELRIGAVSRGPGPRDLKDHRFESFDGHLERLAIRKGARRMCGRVDAVRLEDGRPTVELRPNPPRTYDLLAVAVGVNAPIRELEGLDMGYERPRTTKTFIREYFLGEALIERTLGNSMHVFLLDIPRLEFAAIIPKGDYATVCLLGDSIDKELVTRFFAAPEVRNCFPDDWTADERSCQCAPRINIGPAPHPFADRVVFVGDCAVSRLYKDGIGAAYRTGKAAARTAVFEGISAECFERGYWPLCRAINADNRLGKLVFGGASLVRGMRFARRAIVAMTADERSRPAPRRRMSRVLWDMFTGSASYRSIMVRGLHPAFWSRLAWHLAAAVVRPARRSPDALALGVTRG